MQHDSRRRRRSSAAWRNLSSRTFPDSTEWLRGLPSGCLALLVGAVLSGAADSFPLTSISPTLLILTFERDSGDRGSVLWQCFPLSIKQGFHSAFNRSPPCGDSSPCAGHVHLLIECLFLLPSPARPLAPLAFSLCASNAAGQLSFRRARSRSFPQLSFSFSSFRRRARCSLGRRFAFRVHEQRLSPALYGQVDQRKAGDGGERKGHRGGSSPG